MGGLDLDKLYDNYNILSVAKEKVAEHSKEYLEAIEGTKGDEKLKKLAAQIISKFFKHFPALQVQAIDAIFDLCEDENASIRIAAMKALPTLCKDCREFTPKIADILAQLLQLEDAQEYNVASNALFELLKDEPVVVVRGIFKQILAERVNAVRERCIKFLIAKVKSLDKALYTTDLEDVIIEESKKAIQESSAEEFVILFPFLISTRLGNTLTGQQELIQIAAQQAHLDEDFEPLDIENNQTDRLITIIKLTLSLFSSKVDSQGFVKYICDQVLPHWETIATLEEGELLQLAILRQLAELSTYCGKLDNPSLHVVQIFDKIKKYMPPPPEDADIRTMPYFDFSSVECLLYAFHRLARQCPDFLTHDQQVLKDFRARLMYFSRGVQGCTKALNNFTIKDKTTSEEERKKQKISPLVLNNINTLIKDLFYTPPVYKCNVKLSFKSQESSPEKKGAEKVATAQKRHIPITFDSNSSSSSKEPRTNRSDNVRLYAPPSGKFSNSVQNYENDRRAGGRPRVMRRTRGNPRGRGGARGWRN